MSSRLLALDGLCRYHLASIVLLWQVAFKSVGLGIKTTERAVANLQRDGLARSWSFGRHKLYMPTAKAARRRGLDERRYSSPFGPQAKVEHLTILAFCANNGHKLLTRREFDGLFPELIACKKGMSYDRYYLDKTHAQPLLSIIVPDFGSNDVRRVARKARKEVERRKEHEAWWPLIYRKLLSVTVLTAMETKAERIRDCLKHETFPHAVFVVPEILDFIQEQS